MSNSKEINKLPLILTVFITIFATVMVLYFYGYLNFSRQEQGMVVADFSLVTVGSEGRASAQPVCRSGRRVRRWHLDAA